MVSLSRREFFGLCAAALSGVGVSAQSAGRSLYVYASECFIPGGKRNPFVLGFLLTSDPERHKREIRAIKTRTGYTRLMDFSSTDSLRLGCGRAMLQYFASEPELRFTARVLDGRRGDDVAAEKTRIAQYSWLYAAAGLPRTSTLRLKRRRPPLPRRYRGDGDVELAARLKELRDKRLISTGQIMSRADRDGLVELSSLLTGCLFGSQETSGKIDDLHPTKTVLVSRLRTLLKVRSLDQSVAKKWEIR